MMMLVHVYLAFGSALLMITGALIEALHVHTQRVQQFNDIMPENNELNL